jgi:hypothetical protein
MRKGPSIAHQKDCERKIIDANLRLVPAAISVIDAHLSAIEPSSPMILVSLPVLVGRLRGKRRRSVDKNDRSHCYGIGVDFASE